MSALFDDIRRAILKIPKGKVSSYGAIARGAGHPGAARQVVWALHASQGLPWHRVVGAGGRISLTGAPGQEQRFLLEMEGVAFSGTKVRMAEHEYKFAAVRRKARKTPKLKKKRT